jgi:3-hydroxyisobutyrate dehydrogenase
MAEVAVLGMGRMGAAIARRLAAGGHRITVWNRTEAKAREIAASASGTMNVARTAREAVSGREVVITMLADGAATRAVLLDTAVIAALLPGTVVCDLATSGVSTAHALQAALAAAGARYLDAPVSGSIPAVEAGTLMIMASGDHDALNAARDVLANLADRVLFLGPAGSGQAMKLAVNLVVHDLNAALTESLALAESSGIPRHLAYDALEQSVVAAPYVHYKRSAFLNAATPVAMSLDLSAKDLRLISELASAQAVAIPVTEAVRVSVDSACSAGLGSADMAQLSQNVIGEH